MNNVLLLAETRNFTVTSLIKLVEEHKYKMIMSSYDIDDIQDKEKDTRAIIVYAEDANTEGLVYIKDKVIENNKPIIVVGDINQINDVDDIIPRQFVKKTYIRPFNVKEVADDIAKFLDKDESHLKKKILVVDDSGAVLRSIKNLLEPKYQVILANSGAMAIKYLSVNTPDLVLLDYEMPIVDGKQVLEMIRSESDFASTPVIFLTNKNDKESVMSVSTLKPEGYLLKSLEPEKIVEAIDDFFEKKKWTVQ